MPASCTAQRQWLDLNSSSFKSSARGLFSGLAGSAPPAAVALDQVKECANRLQTIVSGAVWRKMTEQVPGSGEPAQAACGATMKPTVPIQTTHLCAAVLLMELAERALHLAAAHTA